MLTYANARHLDWCYVVYAPMTAWLARAELMMFGTSLTGFRFFAAVSVGLVAVLAGLIARELAGKRRAMVVAAVAASIAGPVCFSGSFLSYMTFDLLCWVAVACCTACLLGKERGWPPATGAQFDALRGPTGALLIGDTETVAQKILYVNDVLGGLSRVTFQMGVSALPHEKMLRSIELLGTRVVPIVHKEHTAVPSRW